ncbi:Gfo/Idh/MocA family protein [Citreimonas salinaria]|uniref:Predicted dehydrogenase n=1 Tax=Citreimonas salinaria TaxID=321339 RepID=A0A1H3FW34_9RHOB|nr:Gfo/Idh/MocA family oxidoreductase [Citreimonas salinaria]SDX95313.1 Predicted dehydrogenase [Citreimonas salinaria]
MEHVRWGILGAAKLARTTMAQAFQVAEGGTFDALATRDRQKAAPFLSMAPGLRVHDSYDALLADPEIDAIYIPLPNHMHVDWTLRALDAGKHVLVEKPLGLCVADYDKVIAARDRSGLTVVEAFMIPHHPQWQKARDLYRDGAIGKLVNVTASFSFDNRDETSNIRNRVDTGGGAIPDIGVYIFGSVRLVTGEEPEEILDSRIRRENGVDVWAHVTARFPSFHYAGMVSMRAAPWQEVTFHGEGGVIRLSAPFNPRVFGEARVMLSRVDHRGGGSEVTEWRYPKADHYVTQVEAFNRCVLEGAEVTVPLEFGRGTQDMIDRVYAAERAV